VPSVWMKSPEFVTWCGEIPRRGPSRLARHFASLYVGAPMVLKMVLRGTLLHVVIYVKLVIPSFTFRELTRNILGANP
jgi:hypothetical protein